MKYYDHIIKEINKNGTITSKFCKEHNIPTVYLSRLAKDNKIFKIGRGVYGAEEFYNYDEFLNIQNKCKKVIFSYFTSLRIQGYSEFIPAKYSVTVPQSYKIIKSNHPNLEIHYVQKDLWDLGVIEIERDGGTIKCYSLERTICDIIKEKTFYNFEWAVKVIQDFALNPDSNFDELFSIAEKMNIQDKVANVFRLLNSDKR